MKSYIYLLTIISIGFTVYWLIKDKLFDIPLETNTKPENFEIPAKAPIEIRQAPIYPERTVASSGPNPPNQTDSSDVMIVHSEPKPKDPYYESQESSDIPENLRHPERSFRAPPMNDNTRIAVESGVAGNVMQVSASNAQTYSTDAIQNGSEFMQGVFANDTFSDASYSAF
jgi:hypothetical protein